MLKCDYLRSTEHYDVCMGTKECDPCSCGGDMSKCDFYPEKRIEKTFIASGKIGADCDFKHKPRPCYNTDHIVARFKVAEKLINLAIEILKEEIE